MNRVVISDRAVSIVESQLYEQLEYIVMRQVSNTYHSESDVNISIQGPYSIYNFDARKNSLCRI